MHTFDKFRTFLFYCVLLIQIGEMTEAVFIKSCLNWRKGQFFLIKVTDQNYLKNDSVWACILNFGESLPKDLLKGCLQILLGQRSNRYFTKLLPK